MAVVRLLSVTNDPLCLTKGLDVLEELMEHGKGWESCRGGVLWGTLWWGG